MRRLLWLSALAAIGLAAGEARAQPFGAYRLQPRSTLRPPIAWLRVEPSVAEVVYLVGAVQAERGGAQQVEVPRRFNWWWLLLLLPFAL